MTALMIGLTGSTLAEVDVEALRHPAVAGAILFARNFVDAAQLAALCAAIRAAAPGALIAVDQEGGRVQRLRGGFTELPPLQRIGSLHAHHPAAARRAARLHAEIMATEVLAAGLDLSFAPVADLARGNLAIGDRAFDAAPEACAELAAVYADTMQRVGMAATLKHFPGHGSVVADTHHDRAIDTRSAATIFDADLLPFATGVLAGARAVMMAHVEYPAVADEAAGYSRWWIEGLLRGALGFRGVVISDDIGMVAGAALGDVAARLAAHRDAGCDLILVCDPGLVATALDAAPALKLRATPRLARQLRGRLPAAQRRARESSTWGQRAARLAALLESQDP
ncbi:MAG: beta-N-acetylhexosaminidase [Xanthomonadales bacterium]|nr:Beta-hexosaminidase [Xanthomonadales bacterium]MCC6594395.1 beta-N-acetylhexosaminidase [Xanthomonadales bacterium]MCE7932119.1 beta-N-acetylhexosaminidase [Xanthomonadales bacterium PRO6]